MNQFFIGRVDELQKLYKLKEKKSASLIVLRGRRRIGKSRLAFEYGKKFRHFIEIQGLGPVESSSNQDQLDHFSQKLSELFNTKKEYFTDWTEAFASLAKKTQTGEFLILLDEISWLGRYDKLFPAKLKEAWDTHFKKNDKLNLIICGSVSFWIENEIIKNYAFEGRISLDIFLKELSLYEINLFWKERNISMGSLEKMLLLSVIGGVPKYLEEILRTETAENNILRLCFNPSGFLFNEYEKIFNETFQGKSKTLDKIVRLLIEKKLSPIEISKKLKIDMSSFLTSHLNILESSGYLERDYSFKPDGSISKLNQYRLKDNYLRFYLKYIEPMKPRILKGGKVFTSLSELSNFDSILGLQFENLVLMNRQSIIYLLDINNTQVVTASPYFQTKNLKTKTACQIDLLIHTNLDVFYLCEIKCKKRIDLSVLKEVEKKAHVLKLPRRSSLKTVLIFQGEIFENDRAKLESFFFKMISFEELLTNKYPIAST